MMKRSYVRFALLTGALGLAAAAVAGCSGTPQGPQAIGTAPSAPGVSAHGSATATSTAGAGSSGAAGSAGASSPQAQAALAAYEGMVNDWVSAGLSANYQDTALSQYMSGSALAEIVKHLYTEHTESVVLRGAPTVTDISFGEMVPTANPTQVVINSCFDDTSWLEYTSAGKPFGAPGGRYKTQVLVMNEDGVWKVDQYVSNEDAPC